ncbi:uncharacterized protein LOC132555882 [Ylistrum balloti]|uniref:uncharacterized protein LOC132555882 n=1 Tax=Ylistrum balloti TaxID=509963 RepID=UPI002905EA27|nr:uncharacterized protein LOC132555882 [Ylistrum balloti]XP_060076233.1 uncharacterized protein LOC132555882 [Ylistrum balloti]XP_060076234.1 uncharacterized protein LOC132555882 [Ylistrum balloti]XP_060076235.1 uncharacterized protein LOC132555882 [Ylistrum balloti]XP_060076237.1 uncharacterized protein LOC132555882 [Ylistrum balloti]XP_060076238.1 uncharacterized protein LOC132555882 [Ylistrum balloti]XP_060076239.1 uncharacterized protein LOC132555882 [Ylistrum balloti]XP_060076240.1 unc
MANSDSSNSVGHQQNSANNYHSKWNNGFKRKRFLLRSEEVDNDVLKDDNHFTSVPDLVNSSQEHTPIFCVPNSNEDQLPDVVSPVTPDKIHDAGFKEVQGRQTSGILKRNSSDKASDPKVPYNRGVSFQNAENSKDDNPDEGEAKNRRRSFKDSGYGSDGSKNNSMGSQNQEGDVFDAEEHTLKVLEEKMNSNTNGEMLPNLSIMSSLTPTNSLPSSQKQSFHTSSSHISATEGSDLPCLPVFCGEENEESTGGNFPLVSMLSRDDQKASYNFVNKMNSMPSNMSASTGNDSSVCLPSDISGMPDPSYQTPSYLHVRKKYTNDGQPFSDNMESQAPKTIEEPQTTPRSPFSMLIQMIQNDQSLLEKHLQDPVEFLKLLDTFKMSPSLPSPYLPNPGRPPNHTEVLSASDLEYISRCRDSSCSDTKCNKVREAVVGLTQALTGCWSLECNSTIQQVGQALYHHAQNCGHSLYKCDISMCHLFRSFTDDIEKVSQFLRCHSLPCLSLGQRFTEYPAKGEFIQLDKPGSENGVPSPDMILITTFGSYGNVAMFTEEDTKVESKDLILKRILKKDLGKNNLVEVYRQMNHVGHQHIVPHLWIFNTVDFLYVCTDFMCGGTLEEYKDLHIFLRPDEAAFIMQQLLEALTFLHEKQIIYLYWTASNVLFKDTSRNKVYLSNLSMSVSKSQKVDVAFYKSSLPACIVPPELVTCDGDMYLEERSDVWGAGCLYAEMLTGKQMWQDLRHSSRAAVFKEMMSSIGNMMCATKDKVPAHLRSLLTDHCWQHNVENRITVAGLKEKLTQLHQPT